MTRKNLRGVFTAIVTPFTADGSRVDEARLIEQIEFQANPPSGEKGVNGIVPVGTTGESPTLSGDEQKRVIELGIEHGHRLGLTVIAGAGSNNTAHAVEMQKFATSAGADYTLSVTPYYNKPNQEGMYRHFMAVADAADIGVMVYNIPGRSAAGLTVETVARLAAHPNIVAVKEATGSVAHASETIQACPDVDVLSGDDPLTLPIISVGGVGVVSVISNLAPDRVRKMVDLAMAGDFAAAQVEHNALYGLAKSLLSLEPNPVGVKTAMRMLGRDGGALRLPLAPASSGSVEQIGALLDAAGLLGAPATA